MAGVALVALGGALGPGLVAGDGTVLCVAGVALGDMHLRFACRAWHLVTPTFVLLCHPPYFTHNFVTHHLALCVAGMALGDMHLRFAWQLWHLVTSTFFLRGRRGACCTWWRAWVRLCALGPGLVAGDAAVLCVAGVALGDTHLRFAWQAWHLVTSTFVLRGKRGACCTCWRAWARLGPDWSPVTPRYFAWQAWHPVTSISVSRGRCGTCCTWWRASARLGPDWSPVTARYFAGQAWHPVTSISVSRGRCGACCTWWRASARLGPDWSPVAARYFAWQAWHLVTSISVSRGRRGIW